MARRQDAPGQYAGQGEVINSPGGRQSLYVSDIVRTGTAGCVTGHVGPFGTPSYTFSYNFSSPFEAPTGFAVPPDHHVIYFID
tara:strand:- start:15 stop:263 length:249 start_codon:yes stop_codon:yes gene_type:complete